MPDLLEYGPNQKGNEMNKETRNTHRQRARLAESVTLPADDFIELLDVADGVTSVPVARRTMRDSFKRDPDFRHGYVANVAMLLHDRHGITNHAKRNKAAEEIIDLIFG